jgi:hypothetical protein
MPTPECSLAPLVPSTDRMRTAAPQVGAGLRAPLYILNGRGAEVFQPLGKCSMGQARGTRILLAETTNRGGAGQRE